MPQPGSLSFPTSGLPESRRGRESQHEEQRQRKTGRLGGCSFLSVEGRQGETMPQCHNNLRSFSCSLTGGRWTRRLRPDAPGDNGRTPPTRPLRPVRGPQGPAGSEELAGPQVGPKGDGFLGSVHCSIPLRARTRRYPSSVWPLGSPWKKKTWKTSMFEGTPPVALAFGRGLLWALCGRGKWDTSGHCALHHPAASSVTDLATSVEIHQKTRRKVASVF